MHVKLYSLTYLITGNLIGANKEIKVFVNFEINAPKILLSLLPIVLSAVVMAVVVKILSDDITHKSDVGGVRLSLESSAAATRPRAWWLAAFA